LTSQTPLVSGDPSINRQPRPDSIDERIRVARADLDRMLLQYTERHPAVIAQKESLQRLQDQRAEQLRALGITDPDQQVSALDSNPVYQNLQIAINDVEADIASLQADVRDRERRLAELQGLIDKVPGVEAELARLNRDYNIIKNQYQALIQSRETQHLSQQASSTDQVDFYVLNPPRTEVKPVAPKRLLLLVGVLVAALGTGVGCSWLLAQLRPVFSNARALREITGLPVLGSVSRVFVDPQVVAKRRLAVVTFSAAIVGLILLTGGLAVYELVGPGVHSLVGGS
jgi:polysaccharide chain length determinant protein (PEP-CTERM system associated)